MGSFPLPAVGSLHVVYRDSLVLSWPFFRRGCLSRTSTFHWLRPYAIDSWNEKSGRRVTMYHHRRSRGLAALFLGFRFI